MRAWKASLMMMLAASMAIVWPDVACAAHKPDGLTLLKRYPDFATISRVVGLNYGDVRIFITLCPYSVGPCDKFEVAEDNASGLADYVYLFAVFRGHYPSMDPVAGTGEKSRAAGLLREAQDKGYGKALLDYYATKTDCVSAKDEAQCVLYNLNRTDEADEYGPEWTQRYVVERHKSGGVSILPVDADGASHPFGP